MLIQGDNLDALKALLPYYKGRVKCIYIDPPYNTRSAFEHYDDNLEHTQWLAMIYPRLELLRDLLAEDGSIWVSIDDNEGHYLKVVMDEVFGRRNFVVAAAWQKKVSPANDAIWFSGDHENVIVYARDGSEWRPNRLPMTATQAGNYTNPDNDARGPWNSTAYTCAKTADERPNLYYAVINPTTGEEIWPRRTRVWAFGKDRHEENVRNNLVYWGREGRGTVPRFKKLLSSAGRVVPRSVWSYDDVGHTQEAMIEGLALFADERFGTPKPERLIERILHIATNPGDLVLDSFLGSGTTAAVAHKMGRRWIGVEMGDHAVTHCAPRMVKVIDGEQGGISRAVNWQGGGGFAFYRLGEEVFDDEGRLRPGIKFPALAAHVWFSEAGLPYRGAADSPFLGNHGGRGFALLYNGILGDKSVSGGNVLTGALLASIRQLAGHDGPLTIYGEASRIGAARLAAEGVTFKQTPYDVKAR
ncbi:MAG: site-specific DNA-methyltransferase [Candidatus Sphingomonas colombiensis]|nr:site-specific DNA-methyltransferase [Sphingomonas sp.]WEK44740.1 MAG: site-specific DNA-methyltransferase [Sphingomonas sp.]